MHRLTEQGVNSLKVAFRFFFFSLFLCVLLLPLGSVVKTNIKLTFSLRTALRALGFWRGGDGGWGGGGRVGIFFSFFLPFQRSDESSRRQAG